MQFILNHFNYEKKKGILSRFDAIAGCSFALQLIYFTGTLLILDMEDCKQFNDVFLRKLK